MNWNSYHLLINHKTRERTRVTMNDKANDVNPDINAGVPGADVGPDVGPKSDASQVIDLTKVSDDLPQFQALPAGTYHCEIEDAQFGMSQAGNPRIAWQFRVVEPDHPEVDQRLLFYHTVTNKEAGLSRLRRLLTRVLPDVDQKTFDPEPFCASGVALGAPCICRVNQRVQRVKETGEVRRRNNVVDVLAADKSEDYLGEVK